MFPSLLSCMDVGVFQSLNSLKSKWTYSLHPPRRMREQMKWWSVVPEARYWKARRVPGPVVSAGANTKNNYTLRRLPEPRAL